MLIRDPQQSGEWFLISREGEKVLNSIPEFQRFEELGLDRVKHDLDKYGGVRQVGGGLYSLDNALMWVRKQENKPSAKQTQIAEWTLIADTRLAELKKLASSQFDFSKLIRLCEELNITYREECYFATGMLTRGLLDHVLPLFGAKAFCEVSSNYSGGGKSFKDTMLHLDSAAKKIADGLLHLQIREREMLPTAQQVNFAAQLDTLLSEIIRITRGKSLKP